MNRLPDLLLGPLLSDVLIDILIPHFLQSLLDHIVRRHVMEVATLALDAVGLEILNLGARRVERVVSRVDRFSMLPFSVRLRHEPDLVSGRRSCQGGLTGRYDRRSLRSVSSLWLSHGSSLSNGRHASPMEQIYPVLGGRDLLVNGSLLSGKEVNVLLLCSVLILYL